MPSYINDSIQGFLLIYLVSNCAHFVGDYSQNVLHWVKDLMEVKPVVELDSYNF